MSEVIVNLKGNYGPGGRDWHRGPIVRETSNGIVVRYIHTDFIYPWSSIERIERL